MIFPPGITVRGILSLTGLAVLAGLSYGLLRWVESELRQPPPAESLEPVLIIERFRAVRFNAAGRPESVIVAPRLAQLPNSLGTRIEQPVLEWYQPDGRTREWRLEAKQGWVATDQQLVRLEEVRGIYEPKPQE
ncbi:MAG: export transporter periplasmic protein LptC [Pseudomonadota bacterium]|nr:export transporter periplasmic protein LptC [Pseudomonadota bacterium]